MRFFAEKAFILHRWPFSETSLVVEAFTREKGRLPLLAKGAKRRKSPFLGTLEPFVPLRIGASGKGEVKTLTMAQGVLPALIQGKLIFWGFCMNELLMRLLAREDPHPALFDFYARALLAVPRDGEKAFLLFQKQALQEAGHAPQLRKDRQGKPISRKKNYTYRFGQEGVSASTPGGALLRGEALSDLALDAISPEHLFGARAFLGELMQGVLEKPLFSLEVAKTCA